MKLKKKNSSGFNGILHEVSVYLCDGPANESEDPENDVTRYLNDSDSYMRCVRDDLHDILRSSLLLARELHKYAQISRQKSR